jgi:SAM-dependent methyltransferase
MTHTDEQLHSKVADYYSIRLLEHGPTARGVDWKDRDSQILRFDMLRAVGDMDGASVLEVGCGTGHLLEFLESRGIATDYTGLDISPAMVDTARSSCPQGRFITGNLSALSPAKRYDFVLASGVFHVSLDVPDRDWWDYIRRTLQQMYSRCRIAMAFNMVTNDVDYRSPNLFYADPQETLSFCCDELSADTTLLQDYPLYEFTVYVYRPPSA